MQKQKISPKQALKMILAMRSESSQNDKTSILVKIILTALEEKDHFKTVITTLQSEIADLNLEILDLKETVQKLKTPQRRARKKTVTKVTTQD